MGLCTDVGTPGYSPIVEVNLQWGWVDVLHCPEGTNMEASLPDNTTIHQHSIMGRCLIHKPPKKKGDISKRVSMSFGFLSHFLCYFRQR